MAEYSRPKQLEKKRLFAILQRNVQPLLASTISLLERQTRACSLYQVPAARVNPRDADVKIHYILVEY